MSRHICCADIINHKQKIRFSKINMECIINLCDIIHYVKLSCFINWYMTCEDITLGSNQNVCHENYSKLCFMIIFLADVS